ncbi:MAG TPA: energy transducer TonB [Candidatus Acidoferrales bacterium]|nr:energy transducer TonB [Candidatus Acidoferrales bacterium]
MRGERFLKTCLVEGDSETEGRAKRRRRGALSAALAVEVLTIAVLVILPLMNTSALPPQFIFLPHIPFSGTPAVRPAVIHARETANASQVFVPLNPNLSPTRVSRIAAVTPSSAPEIPGSPQSFSDQPLGIFDASVDTPLLQQPRPAPPQIIRRSESVQEGLLANRVQPQYPEIARMARISGTVELRAIIGRDGRVRSVEVLSGSPLLAPAAVSAVRQWRYRPTLLDGEAVEVETHVTVRFLLDP